MDEAGLIVELLDLGIVGVDEIDNVRTTSRQDLKAPEIEKKENRVRSRYVYDVKTTTRLKKEREEE